MKQILLLTLIAVIGLSLAGCSGLGGKAVERKAKKAMPGAQTIDEKAAKKVDNISKPSRH